MQKTNILWFIIKGIFLVVFNIILFLIIEEYTAVFWISYACIHFSYIMLIFSSSYTPKTNNSLVFGYTVAYISAIYFIVEFLVGMLFIVTGIENLKTAVIIQLIIAGVYGVIFISNLIANQNTVEEEKQIQKNIMYIKVAIGDMNDILQQVKCDKVKVKVEKVYDAIKSSQVKTYPQLAELEREIVEYIGKLEKLVQENNEEDIESVTNYMLSLISERNKKIKLLH